ncbi:MAG TPA: lipid II flippase MurJ, partial [Armatimonadota bacterium]|nr:lipid II flippase MurJ [Armatimonadota bacterium]
MVHANPHPSAEVPRAQVGQRILRATGALMLIQIIMRGFGLIEKSILGHLFGTSYFTDAYNAARDIASYLFQLADQVIMHSFLPTFVARIREKGETDAWRLASTTFNLLVILVAGIALVGVFFAPQVLPLFVPDWFRNAKEYPPQLVPLTITLTRVMLVAAIFLTTSSLTYCLLNSYKQFALPASADLALKGTVLLFAVVLAKSWGPYALALGFVIGAAAKLGIHGFGLRAQLREYRPVVAVNHPGFKQFLLLALPLLVGVSVSIIRQVMDARFMSSLEEGSYSAIKFAKTLTDVPVQFFPYVFGIALFPFLADIAVAGDRDRLREMLMKATRVMALIFLPLATAVIVMRVDIVAAVFGEASLTTAQPLQVYALTMLISALEIIVLQFYFAMSDTMRPTIVGMLMVPLHIGIAWYGVYHGGWGMLAIPLALLISKGSKVAVLYGLIREKVAGLEGRRSLLVMGKILLALVPFLLILLLGIAGLERFTPLQDLLARLPGKRGAEG